MGTGKSQAMTITGGSALPKDDIDRMMRDAESHAEEDRQRREEAETRNQAESLVYQTEKFVKENDEKLPDGRQGRRERRAAEAQEALKGTDTEAIRSAMEKLATESQKLGAALYQQQARPTVPLRGATPGRPARRQRCGRRGRRRDRRRGRQEVSEDPNRHRNGEAERVVVRDRRRIDPVTGEVRVPDSAVNSEPGPRPGADAAPAEPAATDARSPS